MLNLRKQSVCPRGFVPQTTGVVPADGPVLRMYRWSTSQPSWVVMAVHSAVPQSGWPGLFGSSGIRSAPCGTRLLPLGLTPLPGL